VLAGAVHTEVGETMTDFDAVVVGAGPAGGAAATELARSGASVLLLDRARFPRWKVCGACLSPGALSALGALGVDAGTSGSGARSALGVDAGTSGSGARSALEIDAGTSGPGAVGLSHLTLASRAGRVRVTLTGSAAVSRATLDHALARSAVGAGATFWTGARAVLGRVDGDVRRLRVERSGCSFELATRVVIDATGLGRGLAEDAGPVSAAAPGSRVGIGNEIADSAYPVEPGEVRMVIGRSGYVGLVRLASGQLNVAAAVDPRALSTQTPHELVGTILAEASMPPLPVDASHSWRGTPPLTRRAGAVGAERLLRVGDAAGYVEPFTGEGIGWALADGRAAATLATRALEVWHGECLEEWRRYRRERRRSAERLCRAVAWALRWPSMVDAAVLSLRAAPVLAAPFVRRAAHAPELFRHAAA